MVSIIFNKQIKIEVIFDLRKDTKYLSKNNGWILAYLKYAIGNWKKEIVKNKKNHKTKRKELRNISKLEYNLLSNVSWNSNADSTILRIYGWKNFNKCIESIKTDGKTAINTSLINRFNPIFSSLEAYWRERSKVFRRRNCKVRFSHFFKSGSQY